MTNQEIIAGFKEFCAMNGYKANEARTHKAQYWFLAGLRCGSQEMKLTPYLEMIHASGRCLLNEK